MSDRLSERKLTLSPARLVRWVQAKSSLAQREAEGLQRAFAETLRKDLTGEYARLEIRSQALGRPLPTITSMRTNTDLNTSNQR